MKTIEENLFQIVYFSAARPELTEEALLELLAGSQRRNAERGITGLLLFEEGNIMQVIEGSEEEAKALYATISSDPRHSCVILAQSRRIAQRDFPSYKMGFKRMKTRDMELRLPGFTDMMERGGPSELELALLSRLVGALLKSFVRTTRIDRFGAA